jgi:pimeloyl-ACP methyl ester carboxylesterase
VDAAVAPLGILFRQPEYHGRGSNGRSTGPAVRIGPAFGDEVSVPAQQGRRLDEEASEAAAREKSCQPVQHRSICRLQRGPVHLASKDRHLVTQHDDLNRDVRISTDTATEEAPALVVWASEDRVMPLEHGRRLAELLPSSTLVEIPDSYTLIPLDQPIQLAHAIRTFTHKTVGS